MADTLNPEIRVIQPGDVAWCEVYKDPDEDEAPGCEFVAAQSPDGKFSVGYWQRDEQRRHFERANHEVALILEGEVEIELEDGRALRAGPGDILDTPKGSKGYWRNLSPVRKIWAMYED